MSRKRLLHLANTHSSNIGNGALIVGTESVLNEDLSSIAEWKREAWDDYTFDLKKFDETFVSLINRHDALVVGGAVAINGQKYYANAGMRFDMPLELWSKIERPVIFYGISHRHWPGQPFHHAEKLKATLALLQRRKKTIIAVRNDGTKRWLTERFGIDVENIREIPDPALFVPASRELPASDFVDGRLNIVLAFNDEDSEQRYGGAEARATVVKGLAAAVERMFAEWDVNLVLAPHYFDDHRMIADFVQASLPRISHQWMRSSGLARVDETADFYGRYARADLVIAMRVHAISPCVGLGVPMVPLVTQERMTCFLDDAGLADFAVDARSPDLADRLFEAVRRTLADAGTVRGRFLAAAGRMRERIRSFNRDVDTLLAA